MRFEPRTEQEIQAMQLIEPGNYHFEVVEATDQVSQTSRNEMIKLRLRVWDKEAKERTLFDYILAAFPKKLKHFCDMVGLQEKYQAGAVYASDCLFKSGKVEIGIERGKSKPDGSGYYPDKNVVVDYVARETGPTTQVVTAASSSGTPELIDDKDIPF